MSLPLKETKLFFNSPSMFKQEAHGPHRSPEADVLNIFDIILISLVSSLGEGVVLHINKLESPSPKDGVCQVWLKLAKLF